MMLKVEKMYYNKNEVIRDLMEFTQVSFLSS